MQARTTNNLIACGPVCVCVCFSPPPSPSSGVAVQVTEYSSMHRPISPSLRLHHFLMCTSQNCNSRLDTDLNNCDRSVW